MFKKNEKKSAAEQLIVVEKNTQGVFTPKDKKKFTIPAGVEFAAVVAIGTVISVSATALIDTLKNKATNN